MSEDRWDDPKHKMWSRAVKTRDYFTCQVCDVSGFDIHLESHHLDSWDWCIPRRYDLSNGICLCLKCHQRFHQLYSFGGNTEKDFIKYMKTAKIFLSILSSDSVDLPLKEAREIEDILNQEEDEPNEKGEE